MAVADEPLAEPIAAPDEWRIDKNGKQYTARKGRSGIVYRAGTESIAQALARDALPPEKKQAKPKKRPAPKPPDPPRDVDLKQLERELAEALKSPAMIAAMAGDEWLANHFTTSGPFLARNLVVASEHNPWLRRKLEEMATGEDAMMKVITLMGVGGALVSYLAPPIVYIFNLPVPEKGREMFGIPPRRESSEDGSAPPAGWPVAA